MTSAEFYRTYGGWKTSNEVIAISAPASATPGAVAQIALQRFLRGSSDMPAGESAVGLQHGASSTTEVTRRQLGQNWSVWYVLPTFRPPAAKTGGSVTWDSLRPTGVYRCELRGEDGAIAGVSVWNITPAEWKAYPATLGNMDQFSNALRVAQNALGEVPRDCRLIDTRVAFSWLVVRSSSGRSVLVPVYAEGWPSPMFQGAEVDMDKAYPLKVLGEDVGFPAADPSSTR